MTTTKKSLTTTRRAVLAGTAAATFAAIPFMRTTRASAATQTLTPETIRGLFADLPGDLAGKIVAPAAAGRPGLAVEFNASARLFVGSAIKTFVLCEALRQADSPAVVETIASRQLALDESVWSPDAPSFNPPYLTGKVSERTTLEAMITHSDNTATDMALKLAGRGQRPPVHRLDRADQHDDPGQHPDIVRLPPRRGQLPDVHLAGPGRRGESRRPIVNSPLNNVQTMASSADDLVAYYSASLQGSFFANPATLTQFREILAMGGDLAGAAAARRERLRQGRQHRRTRLPRRVRSRRHVLR